MPYDRDPYAVNLTKLYRPSVPRDFVPRTALRDLLDQIEQRPITLVSAPVGYGKSTVVGHWLAGSRCHKAWLSLDEADNEAGHFLSYVLAAIQKELPSFGLNLTDMLESRDIVSGKRFVAGLQAELDLLQHGVVLVLDDFHVITNDDVLDVVRELLRHPNPNLHLVLLTRHDPLLPLSTWRGRNQLVDIRSGQLRFSAEESDRFLRMALDGQVEDQIIQRLYRKTEGWPAGLRLAALSVNFADRPDQRVQELVEHNHHIADFLAEQFLNELTEEMQLFLLRTSILDRFCAPLCEAVVSPSSEGAGRAPSLLRELIRSNMFVISLDSQDYWFGYHQLLRETLQGRLATEYSQDEIARLHARASRWYAAEGYVEEAIRHALAAGETAAAVELVASHRHGLLNDERWLRLISWLQLFPDEVTSESPDLLLIKAWAAHVIRFDMQELRGLTSKIERLLEHLAFEPERTHHLAAENSILQGVPHFYELDMDAALSCFQRGLQDLPVERYVARGYAWVYGSVTRQMMGDLPGAFEMARAGQREDLVAPGQPRCRNTGAFGYVYWLNGDLEGCRRIGEQILQVAQAGSQRNSLAWGHYFVACAAYHQNQLAEAKHHAQLVFDSRLVNYGLSHIHGAIILALVHRATGNSDGARAVMQEASAYAMEIQSQALLLLTQAFQLELGVMSGKKISELHPVDELPPPSRPTAMALFYIPQLTASKVLLGTNDTAHIEALRDRLWALRPVAEATHNVRVLIEVLALQAMATDLQGDGTSALATLEQSLALAQPSGFIRLYVDLGPQMAALLARLPKRGSMGEYVNRILSAFEPSSYLRESATMVEPLTDREIEVLALLADRLTNKEIAQHLFIAEGTVKRHTINIYQKLGVNGRRDAVRAAQNIGILA